MRHSTFWKGNSSSMSRAWSFMATSGAWVTLARGSVHFFNNTGSKPARMLIVVTPAGLEDFFLEIGREAVEGESEPVAPTPEEIQKLISAVYP